MDEEAEQQQNNRLYRSCNLSVTINPMPELSPDVKIGTSLMTRWSNWQSDFEMYLTASGITDPKRKHALLLYQAGPRVREIFKQIPET